MRWSLLLRARRMSLLLIKYFFLKGGGGDHLCTVYTRLPFTRYPRFLFSAPTTLRYTRLAHETAGSLPFRSLEWAGWNNKLEFLGFWKGYTIALYLRFCIWRQRFIVRRASNSRDTRLEYANGLDS
jgi:hypothetical protein